MAGWNYFGIFLAALVLSFCLTWYVRRWATARGWVSLPSSRDVHSIPVPRIGGTAIFLTVVAVCATLAAKPSGAARKGDALPSGSFIVRNARSDWTRCLRSRRARSGEFGTSFRVIEGTMTA